MHLPTVMNEKPVGIAWINIFIYFHNFPKEKKRGKIHANTRAISSEHLRDQATQVPSFTVYKQGISDPKEKRTRGKI